MLVAFAVPALAQDKDLQTVKVQFDSEGERKVWIQSDENAGQPGDPVDASGKEVELATSDPNGKSVFVRDVAKNKVAKRGVLQLLKEGPWKPKPEDFNLTYEAQITVGNAKGRVANAVVNVKAGETTRQLLLTPEDNGVATVYMLPGKQATVTVTAKVAGNEVTTDSQVLDLATEGEIPAVTIVAPADAEVVALGGTPPGIPQEGEPVTGGSGSSESSSDQTEPPRNPLQTFFNMIVALAVLGGLGYGAWWYYNNNQTKVVEAMKQAGLDPDAKQADPTGTLPVEPAKPAPVQKIVLDPNAAPVAVAATAPAVGKQPKLVSNTGQTHPLQEGQTTVGRENATLTVAESSLSRQHAELVRTGGTVTLTDLGSTNGTYVNGVKLVAPTVLNPGDTVQFGAAQFTYQE